MNIVNTGGRSDVRDAETEKLIARLREAQHRARERQLRHEQERVARGLSARAGTGLPLAQIEFTGFQPDVQWNAIKSSQKMGQFDALEFLFEHRERTILQQLPLGASRFGGVPDLPKEMEWPIYKGKRLPFLAQIDLAELRFDKAVSLPRNGWLLAFGLFDNILEHWPGPVSVLLHEGSRESLVRAEMPPPETIWPDWGNVSIYQTVILSDKPLENRRKTKGKCTRAGWLFGEMDGLYGTPGDVATDRFQDGDDWINLLALKSVGSMQWSDAGDLYLLIRRSALEKRDFSNVVPAVCST